jgi:hypothetical protein
MAKEFNIARRSGRCCRCQRDLQPGETILASVWETSDPQQFRRCDFCADCRPADDRAPEPPRDGAEAADAGTDAPDGPAVIGSAPLGLWQTVVPQPREKKRLFVDDEVLRNFFDRLEGESEPARVNFRFVLALILMRKKLLVYDRSRTREDGVEVWQMHPRGESQTLCEVVDPHMDEEKIAEVSENLGQILEGEVSA